MRSAARSASRLIPAHGQGEAVGHLTPYQARMFRATRCASRPIAGKVLLRGADLLQQLLDIDLVMPPATASARCSFKLIKLLLSRHDRDASIHCATTFA